MIGGQEAAAFGMAFASALLPVINIEAYLVGVHVLAHANPFTTSLAAAFGQMLGKTLFWYVGAGVLNLEPISKKGTAKGKWVTRMESVQTWCQRHWWGPSAVTLVSGVVGLPPFAIWSVMAGTIRMPLWLFWVVGYVSRFVRFWLILQAPGLLPEGLLH